MGIVEINPKDAEVALELDSPNSQSHYAGIDRIVLLVEDDLKEQKILKEAAEKAYKNHIGSDISVASDSTEALKHLGQYMKVSPQAKLNAILDYNMCLGKDRRSTDTLFYDETFKHYLRNGGLVVIYSGSGAYEAINSPAIQETLIDIKNYPNFAFLYAVKTMVPVDDLLRFMSKNSSPEKIPKLREFGADKRFGYDLGKLIAAVRSR